MASKYKLIIAMLLAVTLSGCIDSPALRSVSTLKGFGKMMTPRFIAHGGNSIDVSNALKRLEARATDNWVEVWTDLAKDYETRGQKNLENSNLDDAKYLLLKASVYYRIAAYPYPADEKRQNASTHSINLFKQYLKFLDNPPQLVSLSHETKRITGYFRKPAGSKKFPLILILPGIDQTKEEMYWMEDHFLDKGFATFTTDIPGLAGSDWPLRADSERMFTKILDYVSQDNFVQPDKIIVVGFNFGGYWGLKLATQHRNIRGVVAVSTPIHYAFNQNRISQMPRFMADMFARACGTVDYQEMQKLISGLSLQDQDLIRDIKLPVLVVGSEDDFFVPKEDLLILAQKLKSPLSLKIYSDQPFGVIENLHSEVYPMISKWTEEVFERE